MRKLASEVIKHSHTPAFDAWVALIAAKISASTERLIYADAKDVQEIQGGIKTLKGLLADITPPSAREEIKTGGI